MQSYFIAVVVLMAVFINIKGEASDPVVVINDKIVSLHPAADKVGKMIKEIS